MLVEVDVVFPDDGSVSAADIMAAIKSDLGSEETYVSTCIEAVAPKKVATS